MYSPVLFRPLVGKDTVLLYLTAASMSFPGADATESSGPGGSDWDGRFRYIRRIISEREAVLEFETTIDGKYVNGVDMITVNKDARLVEIKVMIRPLQGLEAVRVKMAASLAMINP